MNGKKPRLAGVSAALLLIFAGSASTQAYSLKLGWFRNPEPQVTGYRIYYGSARRQYTNTVDALNKTNCWVRGLENGTPYFFAVTAYTAYGVESDYSAEVGYPTTSLTLETTGLGVVVVKPDVKPSELVVGATYTVKAKPRPDKVFAGWSGSITASSAVLKFVMESNLVLRALFLPHPIAGTYNGLFYETNEVHPGSSGFFAAVVQPDGSCSNWIELAGSRFSWQGQFDLEGHARATVERPDIGPLDVSLYLNQGGTNQITGLIAATNWVAELFAPRAIRDAALNYGDFQGRYTLAIPGHEDPEEGPIGWGWGALTVDETGLVMLTNAVTADAKVLVQTNALLSSAGEWPFFASLYAGKGSLLGWLTFTNRPSYDIAGAVSWTKPTKPAHKLYPGGFTNETFAVGSRYDSNRIQELSGGLANVGDGTSDGQYYFPVAWIVNGAPIQPGGLGFPVNLDPVQGVFRGTLTDPQSGASLQFRGVWLQKQNAAYGFSKSPDELGRSEVFAPILESP